MAISHHSLGNPHEGISEWLEHRVHRGVREIEMDGQLGETANGLANRRKTPHLYSETQGTQTNEFR